MKDYKLHDEVIIKKTKEKGFIVWYDEEPNHDSILIEIYDKREMPKFYKRDDIDIVKNS